MNRFAVLSCLFALLLPASGFAHGTRTFIQHHKETAPVPVAASEHLQFALNLKGTEVRLSIKNMHGSPISMGMASATVFVITKDKNTWFKLYPNENGQLVGAGKFIPDKNIKFEITLRLPGEKPTKIT